MPKTKENIKYPAVKVRLSDSDGNAFTILGKVSREMKKAKVPQEEIDAFMEEAMSGDNDKLLRTCMKWVDVS